MKQHDPHTILVNQIEYLKRRKKVECYLLIDEFQSVCKSNSPFSIMKEVVEGITHKIDFKELIFGCAMKIARKVWLRKSDFKQPNPILKSSFNFALQLAISKLKSSKFGKKHETFIETIQTLIPTI